ncbi:Adaptor for signal transduction [Podochytrium sp. JEL0797]|nr:Adaptor for signal transduction [Podochytrium sp. JEL0797]
MMMMDVGVAPVVVGGRYVAIYNYKAVRDDELNVAMGERFKVMKRDKDWVTVRSLESSAGGGGVGWVPVGCLKELVGDEEVAGKRGAVARVAGVPVDVELPVQVVSLYDYDGSGTSNALPVKAGVVMVVTKKEESWVYAKAGERKGWVPDAYVAVVGVESPVEGRHENNALAKISGLLDHFDEDDPHQFQQLPPPQDPTTSKTIQLATGKTVNLLTLIESVNIGLGRWIEMEHRQTSVLNRDKTVILEQLSTGLKWVSYVSGKADAIRNSPKRDEIVMYIVNASDACKLCGSAGVVGVDEDRQLELVYTALSNAIKLL